MYFSLTFPIIIIIIIISFVIIIIGIISPLHDEKNVLTSESYPLSEIPKSLLKMKVVPCNSSFKELKTLGIPMVFRLFSSSSLTIPKTPATIDVIVALTSQNLSTCNLKS